MASGWYPVPCVGIYLNWQKGEIQISTSLILIIEEQ